MRKTIRISSELDQYLAKHGKFGESYDAILRRLLKLEPVKRDIKKKKEDN